MFSGASAAPGRTLGVGVGVAVGDGTGVRVAVGAGVVAGLAGSGVALAVVGEGDAVALVSGVQPLARQSTTASKHEQIPIRLIDLFQVKRPRWSVAFSKYDQIPVRLIDWLLLCGWLYWISLR